MSPQDPRTIIIYRENGEPVDTTFNLIAKKWNDGLIPIEPGEYIDIKLANEPTYIKTDDVLYQMQITAHIIVEKNLYFNYVPIEIRGFRDVIKDKVVTTELTSKNLIW